MINFKFLKFDNLINIDGIGGLNDVLSFKQGQLKQVILNAGSLMEVTLNILSERSGLFYGLSEYLTFDHQPINIQPFILTASDSENIDTLDVYFHRVLNIHIEIYLVSFLPLEKQIKL